MRLLTTKTILLSAAATFAVSTPILANQGLGLRGQLDVPQTYGVQYADAGQYAGTQYGGGTYVAPQAQSYYYQEPNGQQYYANHDVSAGQQSATYQTGAPVLTSSYVQATPQIPVGNYTGALGLRGSSSFMGQGFKVGGTSVTTNVKHTRRMLDWQENTTGKTLTLLANRANGTLAKNSLTIGGAMKGGLMWQTTSDAAVPPSPQPSWKIAPS